jgi:chemotaxis protein CheX
MSISRTETDAANRREYWAPLLELSAQEVFGLILWERLDGAPAPAPSNPLSEPAPVESLNVTAMVGLAGSLCGLLTLRCSKKSAALMATKMLGADGAGATAQMEDAVGEVCNMVAGNFKNKISGIGDGCKLSVPTVITGNDYNLCTLANDYTMEINLLFHGNPIVISLRLN